MSRPRGARGARPAPAALDASPDPPPHRTERLFLGLVVLAAFLAYAPAWRGGMLWDDNAHLTPEMLRGIDGLRRIWFEIGATQQYYPVVYTAFWFGARLWGEATLGYHLVNIALHASSAVLLALILVRLRVPGALLAVTAFALHPIQVESVAWMTELKNTLSTLFYLVAALVYLRFDRTRSRPAYAGALVAFVLALLSKTVTATLPGALLVVFWWRRGRLSWRADVAPLLPFFALGLAAGLTTALIERTLLGARGEEYMLAPIERVLLAGRVIWFYLATILVPSRLTFIYPRWTISATSPLLAASVAAVAAALAAAWAGRRWSRAPLAVMLLYVGALFPALGFVNVYPFRYAYVADHFAYLATIPVFTGLAALAAVALSNLRAGRGPELVLAASCAVVLGLLTWRQAHVYRDAETLYRETLARNPDCWLCYNNLAEARLDGTDEELEAAVTYLREALRINPRAAEVHNNYAVALQRGGRLDEALRAYEEALRLDPGFVEVRYNIGVVHQAAGRLDAAAKAYQDLLARRPRHGDAHYNLGTVFAREGRMDEALRHFREAARLQPTDWLAQATLGRVLLELGRPTEAIAAHRAALAAAPPDGSDVRARTRADLGTALASAGRIEEALAEFRESATLHPGSAEVWTTLGLLAAEAGDAAEAERAFTRALEIAPGPAAHDNLGLLLLRQRRAGEAEAQFRAAIARDAAFAPAHHHLGLALGLQGRTHDAIAALARAADLAPTSADAHNDLGAALLEVGRRAEAAARFETALRLEPGHEGARLNLARARGDRR